MAATPEAGSYGFVRWCPWARSLQWDRLFQLGLDPNDNQDTRFSHFSTILAEDETHLAEFCKAIQAKAPKQFQSQDEALPVLTAVRLAGFQNVLFTLFARELRKVAEVKILRLDPKTGLLVEPVTKIFPQAHKFIGEFGEGISDARAVWTCGLLMDLCWFMIELETEQEAKSELSRIFKESAPKWISDCQAFLEVLKQDRNTEFGEEQLVAFVALLVAEVFYQRRFSENNKALKQILSKNQIPASRVPWFYYAANGEWASEGAAGILLGFTHTASITHWLLGFELGWRPRAHQVLQSTFSAYRDGTLKKKADSK